MTTIIISALAIASAALAYLRPTLFSCGVAGVFNAVAAYVLLS